MDRKALGYLGEDAVSQYLQAKGYTIVARNYTIRGGEIDIIASLEDILAFVEVKTRPFDRMVSGFDAITRSKQRTLIRASQQYLLHFPTHLQPRFDAAEVIVEKDTRLTINYIENAFDASDLLMIF